MVKIITLAERTRLMEATVTLDERKAYIRGRLCPFAMVYDEVDFARQVPFAWQTVQRIVDLKGGAFKS